jgi:hypothetical protein
MKKLLTLALSFTCSLGALAALPIFDPFVDATASNGTAYAENTTLKYQTNAAGAGWIPINTNQGSGLILLTGYTFTNYTTGSALPDPSGTVAGQVNALANGQGVRMNLADTVAGGVSNGTVYASMFINCADISNLSTNTGTGALQGGVFHIAFSDGVGSTAANPTILGGRLYFHKSSSDSTKYNIGVAKVTGPPTVANPTAYWDSRDFSAGQELFVVFAYSFNPLGGTNDDTVKLWVNPTASTLGQATEPTPNAQGGTSPADGDLKSIGSLNIMVRNATAVTSMLFDEVRLGTTWASVTSTNTAVSTVVPTLNVSLLSPTSVQLSWRGDATGFTLQGANQLLSGGTPWADIGAGTTSGTNFVVTDTVSGTKFYRLKK